MAKENTLIYRAQTGDERAFADLMRAYHAFVYAIVIGIVDNSHDAEEGGAGRLSRRLSRDDTT